MSAIPDIPDYVTTFSWLALSVVFLTGTSVLFLLSIELYWKVFDEILNLLKTKKAFTDYIWHRKEFNEWLREKRDK